MAQTPLKSLEDMKLVFQRFSFSPFAALSTLSPPQTKGSPRGFASRLFTRGKTGSFAFTSNAAAGLETDVEASGPRGSAREGGGDTGNVEVEDEDEMANVGGAARVVEDPNTELDAKSDEDDDLVYEAESPDEAALVHAARAYRCTLRGRSPESLLVDLPGVGSLAVQLLHVLPFDSNRKRMSVVVRHPLTGQVVVYTKGADSVIMDLAETPQGERILFS